MEGMAGEEEGRGSDPEGLHPKPKMGEAHGHLAMQTRCCETDQVGQGLRTSP